MSDVYHYDKFVPHIQLVNKASSVARRCTFSNNSTLVHYIGSRPSDHYFRSVCWFVCLFLQFFSAVFDPILIKLGHMLYVWV